MENEGRASVINKTAFRSKLHPFMGSVSVISGYRLSKGELETIQYSYIFMYLHCFVKERDKRNNSNGRRLAVGNIQVI